jgi:predicted ArsR family transcriptional regulator
MSRTTAAGAEPGSRRRILELLKWRGPLDARALARRLKVSAMAVRQHLYALTEEKLVVSEDEPRPIGRPAKLWRLTAAANDLFPNAHAELTLNLIHSVRETFGERGLEKLIAARTRDQIEAYRAQVPRGPLRRRVEALARMRAREGYMAEVKHAADGALLLIENHCPICAAAAACTNLCAGELQAFREVLGNDVRVERTDHILAGARLCAYRVSEA